MQCPYCQGKGTVQRPPDAEHPTMNSFPKLCDRCSGSGDVPAAKPTFEGQTPVPEP